MGLKLTQQIGATKQQLIDSLWLIGYWFGVTNRAQQLFDLFGCNLMIYYGISTFYVYLWMVLSLLLLPTVSIYLILEPKVTKIFYLKKKRKCNKNYEKHMKDMGFMYDTNWKKLRKNVLLQYILMTYDNIITFDT